MSDGYRFSQPRPSVHEAEELLRKTMNLADDPFVALSQSYKRKTREDHLTRLYLEDEEDR